MVGIGFDKLLYLLADGGILSDDAVNELARCHKFFMAVVLFATSLLAPETETEDDGETDGKKRPEKSSAIKPKVCFGDVRSDLRLTDYRYQNRFCA